MKKVRWTRALFPLGMISLMIGLALIVPSFYYDELGSMPVTPIDEIEGGERVKIEGTIVSGNEFVIWWERYYYYDPDEEYYADREKSYLEMYYIESFVVEDNTSAINVDMSNLKDVEPGRHDYPLRDLEYCYENGDRIGIVGKASSDTRFIEAEYIAKEADDFGDRLDESRDIGIVSIMLSLIFFIPYFIIMHNHLGELLTDMFFSGVLSSGLGAGLIGFGYFYPFEPYVILGAVMLVCGLVLAPLGFLVSRVPPRIETTYLDERPEADERVMKSKYIMCPSCGDSFFYRIKPGIKQTTCMSCNKVIHINNSNR